MKSSNSHYYHRLIVLCMVLSASHPNHTNSIRNRIILGQRITYWSYRKHHRP